LDLILDSIGAREVDGVYLVIEQGNEADETRHITNTRVLWSALYLTYLFSKDARKMVGVNFFGFYGLALEAVGAEFWASGWYKSLYRLRLADKSSDKTGRAYPSYWSYQAATDIGLENDFENLAENGMLNYIETPTINSKSLFEAVRMNIPVKNIEPWRYGMSNVAYAQEHFLLAAIQSEKDHCKLPKDEARLDYIENSWLREAINLDNSLSSILGKNSKTKFNHVQAWYEAFRKFRRDQNI
jgi:hypothetical protein